MAAAVRCNESYRATHPGERDDGLDLWMPPFPLSWSAADTQHGCVAIFASISNSGSITSSWLSPSTLTSPPPPVSRTPEEWGLGKMALALTKDHRPALLPVCLFSRGTRQIRKSCVR
jgi:hypothetical protein